MLLSWQFADMWQYLQSLPMGQRIIHPISMDKCLLVCSHGDGSTNQWAYVEDEQDIKKITFFFNLKSSPGEIKSKRGLRLYRFQHHHEGIFICSYWISQRSRARALSAETCCDLPGKTCISWYVQGLWCSAGGALRCTVYKSQTAPNRNFYKVLMVD